MPPQRSSLVRPKIHGGRPRMRPSKLGNGDPARQLEDEIKLNNDPTFEDIMDIAKRQGLTPYAVKTYYESRLVSKSPTKAPNISTSDEGHIGEVPSRAELEALENQRRSIAEMMHALSVQLDQVITSVNHGDDQSIDYFCRAYDLDSIHSFLESQKDQDDLVTRLLLLHINESTPINREESSKPKRAGSVFSPRRGGHAPPGYICTCGEFQCPGTYVKCKPDFKKTQIKSKTIGLPLALLNHDVHIAARLREESRVFRQRAKARGAILVYTDSEDELNSVRQF